MWYNINMKKEKIDLTKIKNVAIDFGQRYGLDSVYLFGSYARNEAKSNSDVDLRINKGRLKGLFALSALKIKLEEALGKKVDLLTTDSLDREFLDRIATEEILLYGN